MAAFVVTGCAAARALVAPPPRAALDARPTASAFAGTPLRSARAVVVGAAAAAPAAHSGYGVAMAADAATGAAKEPVVPVLMGSKADLPRCQKIADELAAFGIRAELHISSAHKTPERLIAMVRAYEADGRPKVYIAVAGRSNALSGMLDCAVTSPVISCPPYSDAFGGTDLYSSIRMPSGVAPALVLDPSGAALLAAKILGVTNRGMAAKVGALQKANRDRLYFDDADTQSRTYLSTIAERRTGENGSCMIESKLDIGSNSRSGKVRDAYELDEKTLLLVTTDRQSAFDRVLAAVPYKGQVLNLTSAYWFSVTEDIIPNHMLSVPHPNALLARKCDPFPVEFVVRGYITGSTDTSLWKNYAAGSRDYCGLSLPEGLVKNQKLDANVLTPTTKDDAGDRPISPAEIVSLGLMSQADADTCAEAALALFARGQALAAERGLILVDTKYEFGRDSDGTIRLIDEIHTPDSSRYWVAATYAARMAAGKEPENVDKEFLRLWFADACDPYKDEVLPEAPADLVDELSRRYVMLYEIITGKPFEFGPSADSKTVRASLPQ